MNNVDPLKSANTTSCCIFTLSGIYPFQLAPSFIPNPPNPPPPTNCQALTTYRTLCKFSQRRLWQLVLPDPYTVRLHLDTRRCGRSVSRRFRWVDGGSFGRHRSLGVSFLRGRGRRMKGDVTRKNSPGMNTSFGGEENAFDESDSVFRQSD